MNKKLLIIGGIVISVLILIGGVIFIFTRKKTTTKKTGPLPIVEENLIETPMIDRPYVKLIPRADGKELTLEISLIKNADSIEYELTYLSGDLSRGVIGTISSIDNQKISRQLLLGSCSKNVCKYDENVSQGNLVLKFRSSQGTRKFSSDFHLQQNTKELTSIDNQFKITLKSAKSGYFLTMSTIGLPAEVIQAVVNGPYAVFTAGSTALSAEISLGSPDSQILAWSGSAWSQLKNNQITSLATYISTAKTE